MQTYVNIHIIAKYTHMQKNLYFLRSFHFIVCFVPHIRRFPPIPLAVAPLFGMNCGATRRAKHMTNVAVIAIMALPSVRRQPTPTVVIVVVLIDRNRYTYGSSIEVLYGFLFYIIVLCCCAFTY